MLDDEGARWGAPRRWPPLLIRPSWTFRSDRTRKRDVTLRTLSGTPDTERNVGRAFDGPPRRTRARLLRHRRLPYDPHLPRPPDDPRRPEAVRQRIVAEPRRLALGQHRDPRTGRGDRRRRRRALRGPTAVPKRPSPSPPRGGWIRRCDPYDRPAPRRGPPERPMPLRRPVEREAARAEPGHCPRPRRRDRGLRLRHPLPAGPPPPRCEVLPRSPGRERGSGRPPRHEPAHERDYPAELLRDAVLVPGLAGREGTVRVVHAPRRHRDVPPPQRPRGARAVGRGLPHGGPRVLAASVAIRRASRDARRERLDPARVSGLASRSPARAVVERRIAGIRAGRPRSLPGRPEPAGTDRCLPVHLLAPRLPGQLPSFVRVSRPVCDHRQRAHGAPGLAVRPPRFAGPLRPPRHCRGGPDPRPEGALAPTRPVRLLDPPARRTDPGRVPGGPATSEPAVASDAEAALGLAGHPEHPGAVIGVMIPSWNARDRSTQAAHAWSLSRRRTSAYRSVLIRNELRASFSRISCARETGIVPASTPASRSPRRPVYARPSASATVRAGISSRMRRSRFGVSNKDASPIPKPRDVHRFRSPRTGTTSIHRPRASRRGWDSRPVKTSSAIGGVIAICPNRSRRTRTSPMDSRAISIEASTQTRMGQPLTQAPVRSRSLRSSSSEIRKKGMPFAAARSAISRMGTPAYWAARLRVNSKFRYRARAFSIRRRRTPSRRADLAISDRESRISCASSSRSSISSSSTRTWRVFI